MSNPMIVILTTSDSIYPRMIIDGLKKNGLATEHVFIGSQVAKKWFKLKSITQILKTRQKSGISCIVFVSLLRPGVITLGVYGYK